MKKVIKFILIGFVGLVILGFILDKPNNDAKTGTQTDTKVEENNDQPVEAIEVNTSSFIKEFDENQLAAEEKYKDKIIRFSGYIRNISEDIMGSPFLSINPTSDEYYYGTNIQCMFKEKSELTSLKNGQSITLEGKVDNQSIGIIVIKNCKTATQ